MQFAIWRYIESNIYILNNFYRRFNKVDLINTTDVVTGAKLIGADLIYSTNQGLYKFWFYPMKIHGIIIIPIMQKHTSVKSLV